MTHEQHHQRDEHAEAISRGLDDLAQAERSVADANLESRVAAATLPTLVQARAGAIGLRVSGTPAPARPWRFMAGVRIAAGLGLAAVLTLVLMNRGGPGPRAIGEPPTAFTDAEWSLVFADSGTSELFSDADRLGERLQSWEIDPESAEGAM